MARGNVTVPAQRAVACRSDAMSLTPLAAHIGAVNTFWVTDGRIIGDNTDVGGFHHAARLLLQREPEKLVVGVIGAGGAAAAVLAAVEQWRGASALLWNRTPERAQELAARFRSVACVFDVAEIAGRAQLVVNATTLGMRDDDLSPIDPTTLRADGAVFDLVYRPGETDLVRRAREIGLAAAGGLEMLLEQGALAFERWFGFAPDRARMAEAVADAGR